ncbi:MAG: arabinogalactan endo-1,4-beta-galactosidase [Sediminibacterium sp.]|nr:arabinogalactan endo-1,4-beta-galactosidase [Sediminibacterium sp.]
MSRSMYLFGVLFSLLMLNCTKKSGNTETTVSVDFFAKGADIGWLSEMESKGIKFYTAGGEQQDCVDLLKQLGINSIRLRVWVNPVNGWCGKQDVINQAVRATKKGMKVLIDFHYSDYWADPGKQNKPEAWKSLSFPDLNAALGAHTRDVLNALKSNNVEPAWVQIGNEINDGLLWDDGRASRNMAQFASLVKTGCAAAKEVFPQTKIIIHVSNGYDNGLFRWLFDGLTINGVVWDVIGMSLYPSVNDWKLKNEQCLANMLDMMSRYGKEIMIAEVGMPVDQPAVCKQFISDLIAKTRSLPGNKGLGVFYWEPQCYNGWQGYLLGAFDNRGRPTEAMEAFQ